MSHRDSGKRIGVRHLPSHRTTESLYDEVLSSTQEINELVVKRLLRVNEIIENCPKCREALEAE